MTVKKVSDISSRVWLIAKGPSCLKAEQYITKDDHIASVNEGVSYRGKGH